MKVLRGDVIAFHFRSDSILSLEQGFMPISVHINRKTLTTLQKVVCKAKRWQNIEKAFNACVIQPFAKSCLTSKNWKNGEMTFNVLFSFLVACVEGHMARYR